MHKLLKKALHSDNLVCTFMRSIASSQAASWVDMGVRFALFAWVGLLPFVATAVGCVAGGIHVPCLRGRPQGGGGEIRYDMGRQPDIQLGGHSAAF